MVELAVVAALHSALQAEEEHSKTQTGPVPRMMAVGRPKHCGPLLTAVPWRRHSPEAGTDSKGHCLLGPKDREPNEVVEEASQTS